MSGVQRPAAHYVLAPMVNGVVAWDQATDLVLAPIRLSTPVRVVLAPRPVSAR